MALGGRTIEELKEAMTFPEYQAWVEYRNLHGPLDPMVRHEQAAALIGMRLNHTLGGEAKLADFLIPYGKNVGSEEVASLDDFIKIIGVKKIAK